MPTSGKFEVFNSLNQSHHHKKFHNKKNKFAEKIVPYRCQSYCSWVLWVLNCISLVLRETSANLKSPFCTWMVGGQIPLKR